MKKGFSLVLLFWLASLTSVAQTQTISVTQGEKVTLTLKLVNVSEIVLSEVNVQLDGMGALR